ncbi:MAG: hypothetical protein J1F67_09940 [Muribaculaceae bacterium]|nr:hypothetical protein [Muribaculaceae bacterium]
MKRIFIFTYLLFVFFLSTFGQTTKVTTGSKDLKVTLTGCEAFENTCELTFLMENVSAKEVKLNVGFSSTPIIIGLIAFDDEGNTYSNEFGDNIYFVGNKRLTLPSEIPIKGKIVIKDVPVSAKMIRQLKMTEESDGLGLQFGDDYMIFSNVPISREGDE